ncbi:FAD-dependent oxidoreductase [Picosynechococcus sp. NKBG15041c]|uniref:FAD-dependent oxidoreductase n=1 Tax=Picosynechococcus sp. NKBG15041c TaxID=1407650 RepID=UPI0004027B50|nr:FAD-dependent oxidoreductase [Picosynechococcus sp. NKBG15041c]
MESLQTKVLVVGGGTGGTAAALQCARNGVATILVSEFPWLGGMLTAAGVAAPDGNELQAWQTGLWGAFLRELQWRHQQDGLDHSWVSMFTFDPRIGAQIFADWVKAEKNLTWIAGQVPLEVKRQGDRLTGVRFKNYQIAADIILDGTELGDVLALGDVPHRWGWDWSENFQEPSAPAMSNEMTAMYPVQSPTWVFYLQKHGLQPSPGHGDFSIFQGAWEKYGLDAFMNYGGLPKGQYMINWPLAGNDYGLGGDRLLDPQQRLDFYREAQAHSLAFADYIYQESGREYGLAPDVFPHGLQGGSFALMPYFRESRRLIGTETLTEQQILPNGTVALLPLNAAGEVQAIIVGNYANDHHYPGFEFPLAPKSIPWGGRWTGTPFTIPYTALYSATVENCLACEKNIAVSHMANGATRLQPLVLNIGQAAGQAAALAIQNQCGPKDLDVRAIQEKLLTDPFAPAAVIPLYNLAWDHPEWLQWQRFYLDHPDQYPDNGLCNCEPLVSRPTPQAKAHNGEIFPTGDRTFVITFPDYPDPLQVVTLDFSLHQWLENLHTPKKIQAIGRVNSAAPWFVLEGLA